MELIAVDSNVLIAAHRGEHARHKAARARLVEIAEDDAPWGLPVFCIVEFLRVVTHPRVFTPPTTLDVAAKFIERLLQSPSTRILMPGDRFWQLLVRAANQSDAHGNLMFDAQIAAVCEEQGATRLVTSDRDFGRFPSISADYL